MNKNILAIAAFAAAQGICQTPAAEPGTLQSLLAEVRQLRQSIEAMTVASQRVQIALYALQMQDASTARSTQRLEAVQTRCNQQEEDRQRMANVGQRLEGSLASGALPANEASRTKDQLAQVKSTLDDQAARLQTCRQAEAEASNQLRNDQAALAELRDRMERLDKTLERVGGK